MLECLAALFALVWPQLVLVWGRANDGMVVAIVVVVVAILVLTCMMMVAVAVAICDDIVMLAVV